MSAAQDRNEERYIIRRLAKFISIIGACASFSLALRGEVDFSVGVFFFSALVLLLLIVGALTIPEEAEK